MSPAKQVKRDKDANGGSAMIQPNNQPPSDASERETLKSVCVLEAKRTLPAQRNTFELHISISISRHFHPPPVQQTPTSLFTFDGRKCHESEEEKKKKTQPSSSKHFPLCCSAARSRAGGALMCDLAVTRDEIKAGCINI